MGNQGPVGEKGPTGDQGPQGPTGEGILLTGFTTTSGSTSGNRYLGPFLTSAADDNEADVQQLVPIAGTVSNLAVRLGIAPGNGTGTQAYKFTVRKNGTAQFNCEVAEAATTCSNAGTATFAVGDLISLESDPSTTGGNNPNGWSSLRWAVTLTP